MSMNYLVADSVARIRNAYAARHAFVVVCYSKLIMAVLGVLKSEGYIEDFEEIDVRSGIKSIHVALKYRRGRAVVNKMDVISKPGCRYRSSIKSLPKVASGLGIFVLSTSKGVISDAVARKMNVGGEVLVSVA